MNDSGKTVKAIKGVTAQYRDTKKKGRIVYVRVGLQLADGATDINGIMAIMDHVQRRVIQACADEFLP